MTASFNRFGGFSAILVGIFSILYAVFYLIVAQSSPALGTDASWLILGVSGIFSSAVFVCLYLHLKETNAGLALWGLALGVFASLATFVHGIYELQLIMAINTADPSLVTQLSVVQRAPSQVDAAGLSTFFLTGIVTFIFGYLITQTGYFPKALGRLALANAILLVILYFASAFNIHILVLISGGLTSVIIGPVWWIWLGSRLQKLPETIPPINTKPL